MREDEPPDELLLEPRLWRSLSLPNDLAARYRGTAPEYPRGPRIWRVRRRKGTTGARIAR